LGTMQISDLVRSGRSALQYDANNDGVLDSTSDADYDGICDTTNVGSHVIDVAIGTFGGLPALREFFSTDQQITIPTIVGNASPYPSTINVTGIGIIDKLTISLIGLTHSHPADLMLAVVSPAGKSVYVMSQCGVGAPVVTVDLTFDDDASMFAPVSSALQANAVYKPTYVSFDPQTQFGDPPPLPRRTAFSDLIGDSADGVWSLYITDVYKLDGGSLQGWSINFPVPQCSSRGMYNGGFEDYIAGPPPTTVLVFEPLLPGWRTTSSSIPIELVINQSSSYEGAKYCALNTGGPTTIYQDMVVVAEHVYRYQFAHRAVTYNNETVNLRICDTQAASNISTMPIISTSVAPPPGTWILRSGFYTVPPNVTRIRFALEAVCCLRDAIAQ
jgi:subtilisin-like proprotein convertase family protein